MNEHHSDHKDHGEHSDQNSCTALAPVSSQSALPACQSPFCPQNDTNDRAVEAGEDLDPTDLSSHARQNVCSDAKCSRLSDMRAVLRRRFAGLRLTREQRRTFLSRMIKALAIAATSLFLLFGITVGCLILAAPDLDSISVSPTESATYICDQEGNQLRKLTLSSSNRDIISLDEVALSLQQAIIAIEDERFYSHGGIDIRGIGRAFFNGLKNGSFTEGASTITQQLIKNTVFTEWTQEDSFFDRFSRKIQEQYLALRLEDTMSKEEILEHYLNTINLGAGCYGVQAAAMRYFGKNASELTLSESAVLAAIPQNPTTFNPILSPEKNSLRRATVLNYMEAQGYITAEAKQAALQDHVYDRIREHDASCTDSGIYSYYEDALIDQVLEVLTEESGYSYDQAYRAVYSGGLRIISAQDQQIQAVCDEEFQNTANFPAETQYGIDYALSVAEEGGLVTHYGSDDLRSFVRQNYDASFNLMCLDPATAQAWADAFRAWVLSAGGSPDTSASEKHTPEVLAERLTLSPQPQASVVIIEQSTGFVRAIVGGRGEKTASLTLNRATETARQPGSTFKILTAYAPALDACGKTLATLYDNEPYEYQDGTPVSNWDLGDYSGPTTIRDAIIRSVNVVAVRCITEISPRLGYQYALNFGITTLHERYEENGNFSSDLVQPLALGGITQGVTNLELCGAYAAIADGGVYHKPKFFTQIYDRHGNLLVDYTEQTEAAETDSRRVLKASTAWLLTNAMQDVVSSSSGTAYGSIWAGSQPVAGKTGTTSSYKDIWFTGFTPYYTCSVWGGYDNNEALPDGSAFHTYNRTLWSAIMTRIHASLPAADFEKPEDIVTIILCRQSHLPAIPDGCPDTYEEFFEKGTEPEEPCTLHEPVPETEPVLIYQDLLEELLPPEEDLTEEMTSESASEEESGIKEDDESPESEEDKAESESAEPSWPDAPDSSGPDYGTENPEPSGPDSDIDSPGTSNPDHDADNPGVSGPDFDTDSPDASVPGDDDNSTDSSDPDSDDNSTDSSGPGSDDNSPDSSDPDSDGNSTDSSDPGHDNNSPGSDGPGSDGNSPDSSGPGHDDNSPGASGPGSDLTLSAQPQTSSLDDMIEQLSKYGLR